MQKSVAIMVFAICTPLLAGTSATEPTSSTEFATVELLIEGLVGEWTDVHTAEYASGGWRDYDMDFVKRIERLTESRIRIHRVNGPPPLEVEISPPLLIVFWPDANGEISMVTETEIERLDIQGPTDWSLRISTQWNGEGYWMEMILSGDMLTYLRWRHAPDGERQYTRIHFMKRLAS